MHRVGDDAGEAGAVEHSFLKVEIPRAVLLGQKLALQAVGQPGDNARKPRQLLVEIGAQAVQFLFLAQILGTHYLVKLGSVDLVNRRLGIAPVGVNREGLLLAGAAFFVVLAEMVIGAQIAGLVGVTGVVAGLGIGKFFRLVVGAVGVLRGVVGGLGVLIAVVLVLALAVQVFAHVQSFQHVANQVAILRLVVNAAFQLRKFAADPVAQPGPPKVDQPFGAGRRRCPGQRFAGQQRHRVAHWRVFASSDFIELAATILVGDFGIQIERTAGHGARTNRLNPGLFHRVKHGARRLVARGDAGVGLGIMGGNAQGQRVGVTAQQRHT